MTNLIEEFSDVEKQLKGISKRVYDDQMSLVGKLNDLLAMYKNAPFLEEKVEKLFEAGYNSAVANWTVPQDLIGYFKERTNHFPEELKNLNEAILESARKYLEELGAQRNFYFEVLKGYQYGKALRMLRGDDDKGKNGDNDKKEDEEKDDEEKEGEDKE